MTEPLPIERIEALITYHQDLRDRRARMLDQSPWLMEKQTVQALQHYRDLCLCINGPQADDRLSDRMVADRDAGID